MSLGLAVRHPAATEPLLIGSPAGGSCASKHHHRVPKRHAPTGIVAFPAVEAPVSKYRFGRIAIILFSSTAGIVAAQPAAPPARSIATPAAAVCIQGYVWREAYASDTVCVEPPRREEVRLENNLGWSRRVPGGGAYGPDTCQDGYVWREARPSDHVCVPPASRSLAASENVRTSRLRATMSIRDGDRLINRAALLEFQSVWNEHAAADAQHKRQQAEALRRRIAAREADLKRARDEEARIVEDLRRQDEAWAREHPGLGRSTSPSIADNVSPIERDLKELRAALAAAEREAAQAEAAAHAPRSNK